MQHPFKEPDATCATQNAGNRHYRVRGHLHSTYSDTCARFEPLASRAKPGPSELAPAPSTWKGAIADSLRLLLLEHTTRVAFQHKTRRELGGPFFGDYVRSLKIPDTWGDGDSWAINYVGHPIMAPGPDSSGSTMKTAPRSDARILEG